MTKMETQTEEKKPQTEEVTAPSPDAAPAPEEPIILNQLFPNADKDLDALFPDPNMKKLLKDVIRTRKKNERFLKRVTADEVPPEEEKDEGEDTP